MFGFGNVIGDLTLQGGGENSAQQQDIYAGRTSPRCCLPTGASPTALPRPRSPSSLPFTAPAARRSASITRATRARAPRSGTTKAPTTSRCCRTAATTHPSPRAPSPAPTSRTAGSARMCSASTWRGSPLIRAQSHRRCHRARRAAGPYFTIFLALDEDGNVIPNIYLVILDYTGINYDYNDNMFVVSGISRWARPRPCASPGSMTPRPTTGLCSPTSTTRAQRPAELPQRDGDHPHQSGFRAVNVSAITLGDPAHVPDRQRYSDDDPGRRQRQVTVRFIGTHPVDGKRRSAHLDAHRQLGRLCRRRQGDPARRPGAGFIRGRRGAHGRTDRGGFRLLHRHGRASSTTAASSRRWATRC